LRVLPTKTPVPATYTGGRKKASRLPPPGGPDGEGAPAKAAAEDMLSLLIERLVAEVDRRSARLSSRQLSALRACERAKAKAMATSHSMTTALAEEEEEEENLSQQTAPVSGRSFSLECAAVSEILV